jgi:ABC-type transport system substrate-binding protein
MALVESGEADVAVRVPPQDISRLNANPNITVENVSSLRTIYIYFNHTQEPFTDRRVRQAINYAVNKDEIAEFIFGGAVRPSDAAIAPGIFGYAPVGPTSTTRARSRPPGRGRLPDGFSTTLYSPSGRYLQDIQTTEAIQSQLAEVGINAEIETLEWSSYLEFTNRPAAENTVPMAMLGWGTVTGDADYGLYALFHTSAARSGGVEPLVLQQRARRSTPRRRPLDGRRLAARAAVRRRAAAPPHGCSVALPAQRDATRRRP